MIKIRRRVNNTKDYRYYVVYEKAKDSSIPDYVYWKDVKSTKEWAISDDGYIGEVLNIRYYPDKSGKTRKYVKLSYGAAYVTRNAKMVFEGRLETNNFYGIKPRKHSFYTVKKTKTILVMKTMAMMLVTGTVNYETLWNIFKPNKPYKGKYLADLLNTREVKEGIMEETQKILDSLGIGKKYTAEKMNELLTMAIQNKDIRSGVELIKVLGDWNNMKEVKKSSEDLPKIPMLTGSSLFGLVEQYDARKELLEGAVENND